MLKSDFHLKVLAGFIVVLTFVFFFNINYTHGAQFLKWSYSPDGEKWVLFHNPLRLFSGPNEIYVEGWFHASSPKEKTYVEFGVIDCITQLSVNGINLPVSCDETHMKKTGFDLTEYTVEGENLIKVTVRNFHEHTIHFENNEAMIDTVIYSFLIVYLLFMLILISSKHFKKNAGFLNLVTVATLSLLFILIRFDMPIGIPGEWTYNRLSPLPAIGRLWLPILIFVPTFPLLKYFKKDKTSTPIFLACLAFGLMLAVTDVGYPVYYFLREAVFSRSATSFFFHALQINDFVAILPVYSEVMRNLSFHALVSPPGYLYILWKLQRISMGLNSFMGFTSFDWRVNLGALFYIAFGALSVIPVYYFTKRIYSNWIAGCGTLFFILSSSFIIFTPSHDQVNTFFVYLFLYFGYGGLIKKQRKEAFIAGIAFALTLMFSFSPLIFLVFLYGWNALKIRSRNDASESVLLATIFFSSIILFYLLLYLLYGFNIISTFLTVLEIQMAWSLTQRTFWYWLIEGPVTFFTYAGIPTTILFFKHLINGAKKISTNEPTIPFIITLALMSLIGSSWAEVARMWMYFIPLVAMTAAKELYDMRSRKMVYVIVILLFVQVLIFRTYTVGLYVPHYMPLFVV